jgi:hypothetical protein
MDEPKTPFPALLPWAVTACLAALVACLGELWMVEKARTQMLRDENLLANAALKGAENQIEAERILDRREREEYGAIRREGPGLRVALLSAAIPASPLAPPSGAIAWDPDGDVCLVRASGLAPERPDRDFQLWLLGPGPRYPADCGTFHSLPAGDSCIELKLPAPVGPGCGFMLIYGVKGGTRSFDEAVSRGMIELASHPPPGKMAN